MKNNVSIRRAKDGLEPHVKTLVPLTEKQREEIIDNLRELLRQNRMVPPDSRKTKVELLIEAGYPAERVGRFVNTLHEDGKITVVPNRGFDAPSAKLVLQELMHDEYERSDIRIRAAELALKTTGALKDPKSQDETSLVLAGIIRDIFVQKTPKVVQLESANPMLEILENDEHGGNK